MGKDPIEPRNPQLFRDREKGRPAYVLGGGPSLLEDRPSDMSGACIIAVNHSIWAPERLGTPLVEYWLFGDLQLCLDVDVRKYPAASKWTAERAAAYCMGLGLTPSEDGLGQTFFPFQLGGQLRIKLERPYLNPTYSTVQAAIHLAWILGCDPIHVRGLDLGPDADGRMHWWGEPGEATAVGADWPGYNGQRETMHGMIQAVRDTGRKVTVRASKAFDEKYIPFYQKPMPLASEVSEEQREAHAARALERRQEAAARYAAEKAEV